MKKYIIELKNRFFLLLLTSLSMLMVGYIYKENLLFLFLESEMFTRNEFQTDYFIFTDVSEVFLVYIQLILFLNFQVTLVYLCYHSFVFISSGLFKKEYYYSRYLLKVLIFVWLLSICISKYIFIPIMRDFFFNFQNFSSINLHFEAKLNQYFDFYVKFYYMFIFYCQIFTLLFFFLDYVNTNIRMIKKFRKLYYYCFILFSTFISPPDIFNQIFISFFLITLYEFFIFRLMFRSYNNF